MNHKEALDRAISDLQLKRQEALRKWRDEQTKAETLLDAIGQLETLRDVADKAAEAVQP